MTPTFKKISVYLGLVCLIQMLGVSHVHASHKSHKRRQVETVREEDWDWKIQALRLTGESDPVRNEAIRKLRAIPYIEEILKVGLMSDERPLALDAIAALSLQSFVPRLLELLNFDEDGLVALALNSIAGSQYARVMAENYKQRLVQAAAGENMPFATQVILLDTLGRFGVALDQGVLAKLYQNGNYEVKNAILYYSRFFLLAGKRGELMGWIRQSLLSNRPYQLRLRALMIYSELPSVFSQIGKRYLDECILDHNLEVREYCRKLIKKSVQFGSES